MELLRCASGGGGLRRVALDDAQLCHCGGEVRKADEKVGGSRSRPSADNGQGPGGMTEPAPGRCTARDATIRSAGGPVVGIGRSAQLGIAEHAGRHM